MLKKLFIAIVLLSYTLQAQTYVKGTLNPAQDYSWVVLYQLSGSKQLYVKNTTIVNGEFSIEFPPNSATGMYRLLYNQQQNGSLDFIYNNETVELQFNPDNPLESVNFSTSEENKVYHNYVAESTAWQQKLDAIQLEYFNLIDEKEKIILNNLYASTRSNFIEFQKQFETNTEGKLAQHFIKSSAKYYSSALIETAQQYLNSEKQHYFDFVNFEDEVLISATFLSEKIIDYVFYLNRSDDFQVQTILYKNAVQEVIQKLGDNNTIKSDVITLLLYTFAQIENTILIDFVIDNFYLQLPEEFKDKSVINDINEKVKLAIGKMAPEITWEENGATKNLTTLDKAAIYIVVFWSTSCSHCLAEIPQLYEFTKDSTDIHVVAVALEENEIAFNQKILELEKWTNILGLKKWENPIARDYQIKVTPTYFILDSAKRIIAKPDYLEDIKAFFEN